VVVANQPRLSPIAGLIIGITTVAGFAGASAIAFLQRWPLRMDAHLWVLVGVVAAMQLYGWARPIVLYRGNQSQGYQHDEGYFVVLALVIPPILTIGVFALAVTLGQIVRRRPLIKSIFNLGEVMLAVSVALAVSRAISVPEQSLSQGAVAAAGLGAAVYFVMSLAVVWSLMISMGTPWRDCVLDDLGVQAAVSFSGAVVGILLALGLKTDSWATALAVPLLIVMRRLLAAQFKLQRDRSRIRGLFNVTLEANRRLRQEAVLEAILEAAMEQLRCDGADLLERPPEAGEVGSIVEVAGQRHWLIVSGRRREEPFEAADQVLLDTIAAVAQGALTNAELYRQVRYERGRLASITLNIGEGVCAVDVSGNLTFVNPAAASLVNLPTRTIPVGERMREDALRAPDFLLAPAREAMAAARVIREDDGCFEGRDGNDLNVAYTASAIHQNGEVMGAVIAFRDITDRKRLEATMARQALYDSLTGLANRRLLVDRLESALERSNRDGSRHALVFVDVDRFKAINDSLGHGTGDDLLVAVGTRMKQVAGHRALVSRFGGDEFVILVENVAYIDEAITVARRICSAVEMPVVLTDGYEIVASVSVGVALTEPGHTADDVLRDADVAMYRAKGRGGTYQVFDKALMGTRSSERIELEAALRKSIERGELEVYYQPMVSVVDRKIVGAEALVRWQHPTEGLTNPDRFVPVAEETGLILPIGNFVLDEACRRIQAIRSRLGVDLPISVNLSSRQFQQSSLLGQVASALDRTGLPSNLLMLEITETMVMEDLAGATEIMKKLNRLGVRLAIDDFGTGHSSLGYLKNFPVYEVKVDRTFVGHVADDPVDSAIVAAVVDLADAMGIDAVAEGVETNDQLAALRKLGCRVAQGYLFSRPVPAHQFDELVIAQFEPRPSAIDLRSVPLRVV
jgi:diguanylate cyclase (GGDEF)-like protein/PAS domain S-box-containing protein